MRLREWVAPEAAAGHRIDQCIKRYLPEIDAITLRKAFEKRDVKVNKVRVKQDYRLEAGDQVQIYCPEETAPPLDIVYEDEDTLLINKRAGISVDSDEGVGLTLTQLVQAYLQKKNPRAPHASPAHRLDNQTCGLIWFAKTEKAAATLERVFRERTADKIYHCLVRGKPKPPAATCKAFLLKDAAAASVRIVDAPLPGAKHILTAYETVEAGDVSLLRVHLLTGRTHQIRAHMAALGHPLLGDDLYGDRRLNRRLKVRRLCLCATSITLDTHGALPHLDGKTFQIPCPFSSQIKEPI